MSARNEQEQGYSQPTLDGLMQPETKEGAFSNHIQPSIFQAGVEQGTEFAERVVRIEGLILTFGEHHLLAIKYDHHKESYRS